MSGDVTFDSAAAEADITRWSKGLAHDITPALADHASRVVDRTRSALPRRTGRLAGSVAVQAGATDAAAVMTAPYARYAEFGGRGWPHNPLGNYLGAASRGLESQLATTAAQAAEDSARKFPWSRA